MSLLTRIFSSKGTDGVDTSNQDQAKEQAVVKAVAAKKPPIDVSVDLLKQLFPIRTLAEEELEAFALNRKAEVYGAGSVLFESGQSIDSIFYVLEGTVRIEVADGKTYEVSGDSAKARFPLCSGKTYSATASAKTDIQVLRVSSHIMGRETSEDAEARVELDSAAPELPPLVRESRLFQAFCQHYRSENLQVPSLPKVAAQLKKAIQQDVALDEAARIVQLDPSIAAKLLRVANSPLYLPIKPITQCRDAIARLGVIATRNLVVSFALRQIFEARAPDIKRLLHVHWKHSIHVSCLAYVLAGENGISPEEALLAGLISDIGIIPFLHFAENFPSDYWDVDELKAAVPFIRGPIGTFVLEAWDFPKPLAEIPLRAEDWFHDSGERLTLGDVVMLSKLHSYIGTPRMSELPAINSVPACGKLKDGQLSPEYSLNVLHAAKDKINQAMRLFEV